MFWKAVGEVDYLAVKETSNSAGSTHGPRSPENEATLERFKAEKEALRHQVATADKLIDERAAQYRSLRLPGAQ